jgi:2-oxoglutarate dehydrogenase complex dehydrogenase (E1) component-like enzyme
MQSEIAHRGRLNVLANVSAPAQIFAEFEGSTDPDEPGGDGNTTGATSVHKARAAIAHSSWRRTFSSRVREPVVEGMIRQQDLRGDRAHVTALPILLHGDAACRPGVVAETSIW